MCTLMLEWCVRIAIIDTMYMEMGVFVLPCDILRVFAPVAKSVMSSKSENRLNLIRTRKAIVSMKTNWIVRPAMSVTR